MLEFDMAIDSYRVTKLKVKAASISQCSLIFKQAPQMRERNNNNDGNEGKKNGQSIMSPVLTDKSEKPWIVMCVFASSSYLMHLQLRQFDDTQIETSIFVSTRMKSGLVRYL